ncbi:MAG: hypothetical protein WCH97_06620 [Actinomycetes bacterium]
MMKRLTYANAMSTVAVFIALGGVGWAATTLPANSVGTRQIVDKSVGTNDLADSSVVSSKIAPSVLTLLKGQKGDRGIQGLKGEQGIQGVQGLKGEFGGQLLIASLEFDAYIQGGGDAWSVNYKSFKVSGDHVNAPYSNVTIDNESRPRPIININFDQDISNCAISQIPQYVDTESETRTYPDPLLHTPYGPGGTGGVTGDAVVHDGNVLSIPTSFEINNNNPSGMLTTTHRLIVLLCPS